jgi:hypothetical protein
MHHLVLAEAADHGVAHKSAGSDEFVDALIAFRGCLIVGFSPEQRTPPDRTIGAALREQGPKSAVGTFCAGLAVCELGIDRAHGLVIMERENDWNF